jgi:hypothetical protein
MSMVPLFYGNAETALSRRAEGKGGRGLYAKYTIVVVQRN